MEEDDGGDDDDLLIIYVLQLLGLFYAKKIYPSNLRYNNLEKLLCSLPYSLLVSREGLISSNLILYSK